jgi:hypothetical protein
VEDGLKLAHKHPLHRTFNASHSALWGAIRGGLTHAEYLPLLRRANNDERLFGLMRREWADPVC